MEGMREFLEQIGAGSISPLIELPTTPSSSIGELESKIKSQPRLSSLHSRLQSEIDSINVSFLLLFFSCCSHFIL